MKLDKAKREIKADLKNLAALLDNARTNFDLLDEKSDIWWDFYNDITDLVDEATALCGFIEEVTNEMEDAENA
jgi:hypothetical protein